MGAPYIEHDTDRYEENPHAVSEEYRARRLAEFIEGINHDEWLDALPAAHFIVTDPKGAAPYAFSDQAGFIAGYAAEFGWADTLRGIAAALSEAR